MKESLNITRMLILVVTVFLVVEVPVMIITMLHALSTEEHPLMDYNIAETLILILNSLTCLSSPINLAIYCGTSKLFRDTFRKLFRDTFKTVFRNNAAGQKEEAPEVDV